MNVDDGDGGVVSRPPPIVYDPLLQQGPAWFVTHPPVPTATIRPVKTEPDGTLEQDSTATLLPTIKTEPPTEQELPPPVSVSCDFPPDETFTPLPPDTADPLSRVKVLLKPDPSPCKEEPSHDTDPDSLLAVDELCPSAVPLDPPHDITVDKLPTLLDPPRDIRVDKLSLPLDLSHDITVDKLPTLLDPPHDIAVDKLPAPLDPPRLGLMELYPPPSMTQTLPDVSLPLPHDLDRPASNCSSSASSSGDLPMAPSPVPSEVSKVSPPLVRPCYVRVERLAMTLPPLQVGATVKVAVRRGRPPGSKSHPSRNAQTSGLSFSNHSPDQSRSISSREDVKDEGANNSKESATTPDIPDSLTCDTCSKNFKSLERLRRHAKIHASGKHSVSSTLSIGDGYDLKTLAPADGKDDTEASFKTEELAENSSNSFECKACSCVFTWQDDFKDHLLTHCIGHRPSPKAEKASFCRFCSTRFRKKARLDAHVCSEKRLKGFKCGSCGKVLKHLQSFNKHVLKHSKEQPETYPCPLCQREFKKKASMVHHVRVHNRLNSYECETCSKVYTHKGNLINHVLTHIKPPKAPRVFSCTICSRGFALKSSLKAHMRVHTDMRPFPCMNCEKRFKSAQELRNHSFMHISGKHFQCEMCFKSFRRKGDVSKHVKLMHNCDVPTSTFRCPTCGKLLKNEFTLKNHILTHTVREKAFVCNVCSKGFITKSSLSIHMFSHGNLRPHKCSQCGKGFKAMGDLKKHVLVHLEEKKFICDICSKTFRYKFTLTSHMVIHYATNAHFCTKCGRGFKRASGLRNHSVTHDKMKHFFCDLCSRGFHTKVNLIHHISICATKPFKCIPCAVAFRSSERLKRHVLDHGRENTWPKVKFKCKKCLKSFKCRARLVNHLKRVHSDARPWACTFCGKCFKTKGNRNRHSGTHVVPDKALEASR